MVIFNSYVKLPEGSAQTCGITGPKNWPSVFWGQELRANRIFVMNHLRNFGIAQDDWG